MKFVITESQYNLLVRRLDDFIKIDRQFKFQLRKRYPCDYSNFENYFDFVSYRTEDFIVNKLYEDGFIDNNLELSTRLRKEIANYNENNMKEYAQEYYNMYIKKNCPEELEDL